MFQAAPFHHRTGQRMTHDIFGKTRTLNQRFKVDTRVDAHFMEHEYEILGADVARGTGMSRERASSQSGNRSVEMLDAHLNPRIRIGDAHTPRIVQMKRKRLIGKTVL